MDSNSIENQEIKRKFVDREVYYCASSLVYELSQKEGFDELIEISIKDDYEGPAEEYIDEMSKEDCIEYLDNLYINYKGKRIKALRETVFENITETETAQEFCEENSLDPYTVEALEHWIVSNWLAGKLESKGEMILHDFLGLTIWGRTCSGQAILLDGVISEICSDMEILDGQEYSWAPKKNIEPDIKRLRQVRDALNKIKNRATIEQVAAILDI